MAGDREADLPAVYRARLSRANEISEEQGEPIPGAARVAKSEAEGGESERCLRN